MNLTPDYNVGALLIPAKLREDGISEEKIELIEQEFERFNLTHQNRRLNRTNRMRNFRIGTKCYVPEYKKQVPSFEDGR